jgi:hypothetical protein
MDEKEKWALAFDKGGKRCGYMTSNMAEIFNSILRGVRSLPVTTIASFTFYKCNEWFMKHLVDGPVPPHFPILRCDHDEEAHVKQSRQPSVVAHTFYCCPYKSVSNSSH